MPASSSAMAVNSNTRAFAPAWASFLSDRVSNTQVTFSVWANAFMSAVWVSQVKPLISDFAVSQASVSVAIKRRSIRASSRLPKGMAGSFVRSRGGSLSGKSDRSKLDSQMADFVNRLQAFTNAFGVCSGLANDADDRCMRLRPNPPDMQVGDGCIAGPFNQLANFLCNLLIGLIQQDARGDTHQGPCPSRDDNGTHDAHCRIQPYPSEVAASE